MICEVLFPLASTCAFFHQVIQDSAAGTDRSPQCTGHRSPGTCSIMLVTAGKNLVLFCGSLSHGLKHFPKSKNVRTNLLTDPM
jgi:hypothetical protein